MGLFCCGFLVELYQVPFRPFGDSICSNKNALPFMMKDVYPGSQAKTIKN